jgi:hypothetical protein
MGFPVTRSISPGIVKAFTCSAMCPLVVLGREKSFSVAKGKSAVANLTLRLAV